MTYTVDNLKQSISYIEDGNNYFADFKFAYRESIRAREMAHCLFSDEILSDENYRIASERIEAARKAMITTIREWTANALMRSESKLTRKEIVYSVFEVLFY